MINVRVFGIRCDYRQLSNLDLFKSYVCSFFFIIGKIAFIIQLFFYNIMADIKFSLEMLVLSLVFICISGVLIIVLILLLIF